MDATVRRLTLDAFQGDIKLDVRNLVHFRPYIEEFLGLEWVETKVHAFDEWVWRESDPVFVWQQLDRQPGTNPLIAAIWGARRWESEWRSDSDFMPDAGPRRLFHIASALALTEIHAGPLLDSRARARFRSRLRADDHALGAIHECETFVTFLRMGAQPVPLFLCPGSPVDVELHWSGYTIPVHCKSKEPGVGRFIPSEIFVRLATGITLDDKRRGRKRLVRLFPPAIVEPADIPVIRRLTSSLPDRTPAPYIYQIDTRLYLVAPKFNIISQPNDWQKTVATAAAGGGSLTPFQQLHLDYWTQFRQFMEDRKSPVRMGKPSKDYWTTVALGRTNFRLVVWNGMRDGDSSVYVSLTGPLAKPYFYLLRDTYKDQIEAKLGTLEWRELPNAKESQIGLIRPGKPSDTSTWPELNEWMADQIERWVDVFRPIVKGLDASQYTPPAAGGGGEDGSPVPPTGNGSAPYAQ